LVVAEVAIVSNGWRRRGTALRVRRNHNGTTATSPAVVVGPPDPRFSVAMLQIYTGTRVGFGANVSNQVQPPLATALTALVAAMGSDGVAGNMQIVTGFSPAASNLTSVGRAVLMRHPAAGADRLAGYMLCRPDLPSSIISQTPPTDQPSTPRRTPRAVRRPIFSPMTTRPSVCSPSSAFVPNSRCRGCRTGYGGGPDSADRRYAAVSAH
jgi:hypothetical protein